MERIRRNGPCPCGSGKKYKVCCLQSKSVSDPTEHPLLEEANQCFRLGFFDGAATRCDTLEELSPELEAACAGVAWFSRVYSDLTDNHERARRSKLTKQIVVNSGQGGQGAAELSWLHYDCWDGNEWRFPNGATLKHKNPFRLVLDFIDNQHGVLVSFHPTAVLRLAQLAVKSKEILVAKSLINSVLGWRSAFANGSDLEKLAELLLELDAPIFLWADWAAFYFQHVQLSYLLAKHSAEFVDAEDFQDWSTRQDRESQFVLSRVFAFAPPELLEIMAEMNAFFGWEGFEEKIAMVAKDSREVEVDKKATLANSATWYGHPDIRTRYFWFDMLTAHEQAFITNGDWALGCTPTDDYSMGLAQWWRLIESVFGRIVRDELGSLFDTNPEWLKRDLEKLSQRSLSSEAVFLKKLAVAESRDKMTLADILRVLEKCVIKPRQPGEKESLVRQKATEFFAPHAQILSAAVQARGTKPFLTLETIGWFRNRASHSRPIGESEACVGRLVAKRVVELLFLPQLKAWGFEARIPVFTL